MHARVLHEHRHFSVLYLMYSIHVLTLQFEIIFVIHVSYTLFKRLSKQLDANFTLISERKTMWSS